MLEGMNPSFGLLSVAFAWGYWLWASAGWRSSFVARLPLGKART